MGASVTTMATRQVSVAARHSLKRTTTTTTTGVRSYTGEPPATSEDVPQDQAAYDAYLKSYKNREQFDHTEYSFYDYEHDMAPDRNPQPSNQ